MGTPLAIRVTHVIVIHFSRSRSHVKVCVLKRVYLEVGWLLSALSMRACTCDEASHTLISAVMFLLMINFVCPRGASAFMLLVPLTQVIHGFVRIDLIESPSWLSTFRGHP